MWFWIGVTAVAVAVYLLLRWKDRGGRRPFYQTREEVRGSDQYGRSPDHHEMSIATPSPKGSLPDRPLMPLGAR